MNPEPKMTDFQYNGLSKLVTYIRTDVIKTGVSCDVYTFVNDDSRDLAIITVQPGCSTPKQRVLKGDQTIEGYMSGEGRLVVGRNGQDTIFEHKGIPAKPVSVMVGDTMQWTASDNSELKFYELCTSPFAEGRFENI